MYMYIYIYMLYMYICVYTQPRTLHLHHPRPFAVLPEQLIHQFGAPLDAAHQALAQGQIAHAHRAKSATLGGSIDMGVPPGFCQGKSHLEMEDDWGLPLIQETSKSDQQDVVANEGFSCLYVAFAHTGHGQLQIVGSSRDMSGIVGIC